MDSFFKLTLAEMFPDLDEEFRIELENNVREYLFKYLLNELYGDDKDGLEILNKSTEKLKDDSLKSDFYYKIISEKINNLDQVSKQELIKKIEKEVAIIMHKLYIAYKGEDYGSSNRRTTTNK